MSKHVGEAQVEKKKFVNRDVQFEVGAASRQVEGKVVIEGQEEQEQEAHKVRQDIVARRLGVDLDLRHDVIKIVLVAGLGVEVGLRQEDVDLLLELAVLVGGRQSFESNG